MIGPQDTLEATSHPEPSLRRGCRTDGCTCEDRRIVSRRRAAFWNELARQRGETAHRVVAPQRGWRIGTW
jgi:hypothetical protein